MAIDRSPTAHEPGPAPAVDDGLAVRLDDFPARWPIATRWADNDHYGHVNNVTYYSYLDTAVNGWLLAATATDIRNLDAIGLVVETACRFLAPVSFPAALVVGLGVVRLGRSSVTYRLGVFPGAAAHEQHAATGPVALARFVHVYVDRTTRTSVPVPDVVRAAVTGLLLAGTADP